MSKRNRLYVDMDGVLAVFNTNISSTEELYAEGYFRNLAPQQNVVEAVKKLIKGGDMEVYILSAYLGDSEYALKEKNEWLDEHLPEIKKENRVFVPCGVDKKEAIPDLSDKDFLLDDYTHNLLLWQPPARGIKLLNDINHTKGSWMHDRISYNRKADDLAGAITDVVCHQAHVYDEKSPAKKERGEGKTLESLADKIESSRSRLHNAKRADSRKDVHRDRGRGGSN